MSDDKQPNTLGRLILDRMAELGLSFADVSRRAAQKCSTPSDPCENHKISRASVHAIANQYARHHAPYKRTLHALAAGLDYPYDVVAAAAADSAGYTIQEIKTSLKSAGTLRILAAVHEELTPEQQQKLARMAEEYAAQLKQEADEIAPPKKARRRRG